MTLLPEGKVKTMTGISSSAMPDPFVPVIFTSTPRKYALATSATDNVAGFLQSIAEKADETINVSHENQTGYAIAANTSIAIGDKLKLDGSNFQRVTKLTPSASGAPAGYSNSIAEALEIPSAIGAHFLVKYKKERIAI